MDSMVSRPQLHSTDIVVTGGAARDVVEMSSVMKRASIDRVIITFSASLLALIVLRVPVSHQRLGPLSIPITHMLSAH